jgi:hypothetical protein
VIAGDFPFGCEAALRAGNEVVLFVAASLTTLAEPAVSPGIQKVECSSY